MPSFNEKSAVLFLLLVVMFVIGCSGAPTQPQEEGVYYWPLPPDPPKIAYVRSFQGESDYQKGDFFRELLGYEPEEAKNLIKPYGVYANSGKVYVTDSIAGVTFILNTIERKVNAFGDTVMPIGVTGTRDGIIFVSDTKLKKVIRYDVKMGTKMVIGKQDEFKNPGGLAVNDELGRLYIADGHGHNVHVYSTKGDPLFVFGNRGAEDGQFNFPINIAIDKRNGNLYVVDSQNFRVQVLDKDGKFIRKFGEVGANAGNFARPKGIGIDTEGNVYVVDGAFENFQVFNEKGELLIAVGSAGTGPGNFYLPAGMYVDENDTIYVVDSANRRVQVFQYLSEKWKKANPEEYKKYLPK
ncbi:MAG: 6-bladed beta-propeller [Nitrospirae bacterium]|nr:6-bladed beta-propeller [Nitrospirota bacterium]